MQSAARPRAQQQGCEIRNANAKSATKKQGISSEGINSTVRTRDPSFAAPGSNTGACNLRVLPPHAPTHPPEKREPMKKAPPPTRLPHRARQEPDAHLFSTSALRLTYTTQLESNHTLRRLLLPEKIFNSKMMTSADPPSAVSSTAASRSAHRCHPASNSCAARNSRVARPNTRISSRRLTDPVTNPTLHASFSLSHLTHTPTSSRCRSHASSPPSRPHSPAVAAAALPRPRRPQLARLNQTKRENPPPPGLLTPSAP